MGFSFKPTMNIWLDCTSIMEWERSHLTGIQRTLIGVYKGWKSLGLKPLLYRYDQDNDCFVHVNTTDLPELIRLNLENQEWMQTIATRKQYHQKRQSGQHPAGANTENPPEAEARPAKNRILRRIAGEGEAADELIQTISANKLALWKLQKATRGWLKARMGSGVDPTPTEDTTTAKKEEACQIGTTISSEDYFFSIGSESYQIPANVIASQRLRANGGKVIRMIYDVIPVSQPQWVYAEVCRVFGDAMRIALPNCDLLLTISEHSRTDLISCAHKENIKHPAVVPIRLGDVISGKKTTGTAEEPDIREQPRRPFFLCLGTIEPRKNQRLLYDCWRRLSKNFQERCPDLVCIGSQHQMCTQLIHEITHDPLTKERIILLKDVGDGRLEWYYDHCLATIFPSLYEGWGLPVAESLARGRLCLASNASSIPEISELAILFDPQDVVSLSELVMRTSEDSKWRASEEEKIRTQFKPTTWMETAEQVLAATERLRSAG
jgi:glycosyltransferase involved in cell wall biosynthesis